MNVYNVIVFLEDTDAGGIVYHSRYLNFMERCRTRSFYHKGIDHAQLIASHTGHFLVNKVSIDFLKPACLGDELTVTLEVIDIRGASLVCVQNVMRDNQLLAKATIILAFVNPDSGKAMRIPELLKVKMR